MRAMLVVTIESEYCGWLWRAIDKVVHALHWRAGLRPALGVPTLGAPPESAPHPDWRVESGPEARAPDFVNGLGWLGG